MPPPKTIEAYLAPLPPEQRRALEDLQRLILEVAPEAVPCISYGMPGYRLNRMLVWIGAAKAHCALYPKSLDQALRDRFAAELSGFQISKGAIRFTPDRPIPEAVVRAIIAHRVAENSAKARS